MPIDEKTCEETQCSHWKKDGCTTGCVPLYELTEAAQKPQVSPSNSSVLLECMEWHERLAEEADEDMKYLGCGENEDVGTCGVLLESKARNLRFAAALKRAL